ncbi:uncharacterized protein F5891DRAFT_1248179 [Suillus fuscotomentosus]|uniref:GCN1-like HEAT repeats domain-containing protein n=1 Tax=Suillus fuscotomentosus TaxID=1912939 RepID=A0AAD4HI00_9AGAM|nr:uncharacterized protein F5891DRAFT_1248179 [Suillus fuscotomentosus]KAG1896204.1 hypothetical protein F5891DRAFT_1248179 [Suillus fuscotomentosus]
MIWVIHVKVNQSIGTPSTGLLHARCIHRTDIVLRDRLDTFHNLGIVSVPEEVQAEQLSSLVLRVLYRLRSLSEQTPFDTATFSYALPLLAQVLLKGGVDAGQDDGDKTFEQITLVLNIIKLHCSEFSDAAFPRTATVEHVLYAIRHQPRLSKEALSVLIDLREAVQSNATRDEVGVLIDGTLLQEVYFRNACLQAIQVSIVFLQFALLVFIVFVAIRFDRSRLNARLANYAWEDNGLDVPEDFLDKLMSYLEHNNAYVRTSTALAIAEATSNGKRYDSLSFFTRSALISLKAKILAPEFDQYGMVIASSLDRSDPWATQAAAALAFEHLAPSFTEDQVEPFFVFLIKDEALGGRSLDVRRSMLRAGADVIDIHGSKRLAGLLSTFEEHLGGSSAANETGDQIKEAVLILFGRVAGHLDASDTCIPSIVDQLVEALKTPRIRSVLRRVKA